MREHPKDSPAETVLRLLATSDVHMHLTGWDGRVDDASASRGFNRLASVIRAARADAPGPVLLLDNGDSLQGTPLGEVAVGMAGCHPWAELLDTLEYDAAGLGNHDFDFGLDALTAFCAASRTQVVSASPDRPLPNIVPHIIVDRTVTLPSGHTHPLRVGITSVLPPQTLVWNHALLAGKVGFLAGVDAARQSVAALRRDGADIIVVLCHSGISSLSPDDTENFACPLAHSVPGVDAMILGHTHERFPDTGYGTVTGVDPDQGTLFGVPAAMPGFAAALLAQIDLCLVHDHEGWHVTEHSVRLRDLEDAEPDRDATRLAAPCIAATRARMQTVVGQTGHGFHSYFAMLQSGTADAIVATAMQRSVKAAINGTDLAHLPVLSAIAPAAAGGRAGPNNYVTASKGEIQARHLAMMCPYQNTVWAQRMTGATLAAYLERSAQFFAPHPSGLGPLLAPNAPAFNFDTVHGLHMTLDPFAPLGARVTSLTRNGVPVSADDAFLVAMTSYRGAGGGDFPGLEEPASLQLDVPVVDALRSYLAAHPIGDVQSPSVWSFASAVPRHVLIETSPRAVNHLEEIAHFRPEPLGLTDTGFMSMRVTL
ncbi:5'-nucleotidase C-terminal domain-containing protein [uncultured Tateyamaria sp.]|uniref:5'-nucleotidase C-terminal domain-containing protein n=1 Tax=Tateyamaria sp. 1078 TaxID=3417464 RepID=UPI0026167D9D|nr:5'-nucleotidase C-terminal domain-containing protein [uncultured Tateyamaria sp.]